MSHISKKEKGKIPNLFGIKILGTQKKVEPYLYVSYAENLPKRAMTNVFLPDFKGDWYGCIQGWPVHVTVVEESEDYIEIIGDKWEMFTEVIFVGDSKVVHRTTKTPDGIYEEDYKIPFELISFDDKKFSKLSHERRNSQSINIALHSLGWGFPDGFTPDELKLAMKFNSRPIEL